MRPWVQALPITTRTGGKPHCHSCLIPSPCTGHFSSRKFSRNGLRSVDNLSWTLWCAVDRDPINTAPNYFHRQVAPACSRALGERLTSFALNSLQHPFTNMVKCEPNPWLCLCKGTFFPWAKIANLNGFHLLHGWLPVQSACSLCGFSKGSVACRPPRPPCRWRSYLWTRGPTQLLSIASKGKEMASFRRLGWPES